MALKQKRLLFLFIIFYVVLSCNGYVSAAATDGQADYKAIVYAITAFAAVFLLYQLYISRLKKKIIQEQGFSKSILDNAKTMIIVSALDGTIVMFNKYAQEVSGYSPEEAEGKKIYEVPFLNEGADLGRKIYESLLKDNELKNAEICLLSKDKRLICLLWNLDLIRDAEGKAKLIMAVGVDITERKDSERMLSESYRELEAAHEELLAAEEELKKQYRDLDQRDNELKRSEERYRLAVEGVNDGVWDWDGRNMKLFISKRGRSILGIDPDKENINMEDWFGMILAEDLERFRQYFTRYITEPKKGHFQIDYRTKVDEGCPRWIRTRGVAIWDEEGIPIRVAGSITDVTDQKLSDEKIHRLAYYDSMTGLPNRAMLNDRFAVAAANAQRNGQMVVVLFLDLDNFKTINDKIGHSFGDQLLLKVGEELKLRIRKGDTIARLGGDEFIILQANVKDMDEVSHLASRILDIFKQQWVLDGRELYITASLGISVYPNDGVSLQRLLKNADIAMYRAKESGKNSFEMYTPELNLRIARKLEVENYLRKATDADEFILYYQPQIELATGRIKTFEALIRWSNPVIGWTQPEDFIATAEEIGVIGIIGEWVLRTACKQLLSWHNDGYRNLKVSINLSASQFYHTNLVEMLKDIIKETVIEGSSLELEIAESTVAKAPMRAVEIMRELKDMGVGISLDDFGRDNSSLNYLRILPIDNLKIDKSFIHDITNSHSQKEIVKAVISLAHNMELTVVAEGVENVEQLELLKKVKCDIVQGYMFCRPKPACELEIVSYKAYV